MIQFEWQRKTKKCTITNLQNNIKWSNIYLRETQKEKSERIEQNKYLKNNGQNFLKLGDKFRHFNIKLYNFSEHQQG